MKTYDPSNVQIILGAAPMSGFADGTFITVTYDENLYNKTVGADGEVSRSRTNNRTATVTLTLKQTSRSNDALSAIALLDEADDAGVVPLMIVEIGSGNTILATDAAWIEKLPDTSYSKDIEDRAWTISTANLKAFIGGNSESGV